MSLYLCGAKAAPWRCAHVVQLWCTHSSVLQLLSVSLLTTRMLMLSTNPMADTFLVLRAQKFTRSLLKNKKRMGEMGDPCGMPVDTRWVALCHQPSTSDVCQSARKLVVHWRRADRTLLW